MPEPTPVGTAYCFNCGATDIQIQQKIWGNVETNGSPQRMSDGTITYEPSGYTEILWDTVGTEVAFCPNCSYQHKINEPPPHRNPKQEELS